MKPVADVVFGLGFGDEGKGQTVCNTVHRRREESGTYPSVVRYSGGCQNEHNVIWTNFKGKQFHHTYSQIGSTGYLSDKSTTFTWRAVPVDLEALFIELNVLHKKIKQGACLAVPTFSHLLELQRFHEECLLITPLHRLVSIDREAMKQHGTTGRGIYPAQAIRSWNHDSAMTLGDFANAYASNNWTVFDKKREQFFDWLQKEEMSFNTLEKITQFPFKEWLINLAKEYSNLDYKQIPWIMNQGDFMDSISTLQHLVFESGQGVLLDKDFGFFPHVTYANTIPIQAMFLCEQINVAANLIGVTRGYATRHGAGFLPYDGKLKEKEPHNTSTAKLLFRTAPLSRALLTYSIDTTQYLLKKQLSEVAITRLAKSGEICVVYDDVDYARKTALMVTMSDVAAKDDLRRQILLDFTQRFNREPCEAILVPSPAGNDVYPLPFRKIPEIERI